MASLLPRLEDLQLHVWPQLNTHYRIELSGSFPTPDWIFPDCSLSSAAPHSNTLLSKFFWGLNYLFPRYCVNLNCTELGKKLDILRGVGSFREESQSWIWITWNARITQRMRPNLPSELYDSTKADSIHYLVLSTTHNGSRNTWHIEISFMVRIVTYFLILGLLIILVSVLFKCLGVFHSVRGTDETAEPDIESEANPLMPEKEAPCQYGTMEDNPDSNLCGNSATDLYDGKICVICYDGGRNCFFVPCGHSATCYTCAQKIMEEESKVCPICRRLIHRVRRLFAI
ncbi:hypothetical protein H6P81_020397 [Aristolochia fimbriata]|uniref:RING-type domain-containing protein n=1 Tax=Aristolochia fimbriata TaxID=158543 RepID=A0AAV7DYN9_ARIFI|nr:hypothetical protein H6P81_020397 [Aristolochia fimbriata]